MKKNNNKTIKESTTCFSSLVKLNATGTAYKSDNGYFRKAYSNLQTTIQNYKNYYSKQYIANCTRD